MDAFDLLPSLADGELSQTSALDLVAAIVRSRASGTLSIEAGDGTEIRQYFRMGNMCGSAFFAGFRTLAQVLLQNDWVNALDIDASLADAQATGKRHGQVLVERQLLTPDQLKAALAGQHKQNLGALLALDSGHYELRGWEPPPAWSKELQVDPSGPLILAFAEERARPRRQRVLDWLGSSAARLSVDWPELSQRIDLDAPERRAAALLALPRKQEEYFRLAHLEPARAEALLVTLLLVGAAEPQPAAVSALSSPPPQPQPPPGARTFASPPHGVPRATPLSRPPPAAQPAELAPPHAREPARPASTGLSPGRPLIPPESRAARSVPPRPPTNPVYLAPPVEPPQPEPQAEPMQEPPFEAQFEPPPVAAPPQPLAEPPADYPEEEVPQAPEEPLQYRPEMVLELDETGRPEASVQGFEYHAGRSQEPPAIPPQSAQDAASSDERRKRMRATGLRNLLGQSQESRPVELTEGGVQDVRGSAPVDESQLTGEGRRFVEEVRLRAAQVQAQDAYQRLGVARTAGSDIIRTAYLDAAKRFHPDRASAPGLQAIAAQLQTVFSAMKDAYDSLSSAQARAQYDAQLKAGSGPGKAQGRKDEAVMALKMGEVLLKKRDFGQALLKLRRSVELDPNGDSMAALAWAMMCDPSTSPAGKEEAAAVINKALRAAGISARTYYVAGVMWRSKDPDSAADAFRKALELEPNHADASLELRLLEMRQGRKQQGGGVLSGLLFGKRK